MSRSEQIEHELAKAAGGLREGNDGLARVCARRAVALGAQAWVQRGPRKSWQTDSMSQLRQIQQEASFPLHVRQAAERLLTKVTQREQAPFSTDPIADAKRILAHFEQQC